MLRKMTCAAGGIALAIAAACSIALIAQSPTANLDLRWLHASAKADRLPVAPMPPDENLVVSFDLPSQSTTIVTRSKVRPRIEGAVRILRPNTVRTIPVQPVREVPNENQKQERLPVGCEPAFSPVTTPAFAHISVRCDS